MADWAVLRARIDGELILPGTPGYDAVRRPAIARFRDVRPAAVVRCATPADVAETLSYARRSDLRVAVRSGGHCFAGRSSTEGIVLDVTPMSSVAVHEGTVTVGAGTRLGDLYDALAGHGVTIPAGCGPTVGIAGLTLGGGLGVLGRAYGLTCDRLRSAHVVLRDGRMVGCDELRDAELFWALRGGGNGTVGVVTSLEFATVPAPASTAFHLTWPYSAAAAVIEAWQAWSPDAPDELAASLLISAAADTARAPVISMFGAMAGAEAACRTALNELAARVGSAPASAAFRQGSHRQVKRYLSTLDVHGDGPDPDGAPAEDDGHAYSKSEFFARALPADAVAALVDHLTRDRMPGQSRELDFTPWGGAYNRVPVDATAFPHRTARFLLKQAIVVDAGASAAGRQAAARWLARSWELVHPWGTGGVYPNFPDPDLPDPDAAYYGTNLARLREVMETYGP